MKILFLFDDRQRGCLDLFCRRFVATNSERIVFRFASKDRKERPEEKEIVVEAEEKDHVENQNDKHFQFDGIDLFEVMIEMEEYIGARKQAEDHPTVRKCESKKLVDIPIKEIEFRCEPPQIVPRIGTFGQVKICCEPHIIMRKQNNSEAPTCKDMMTN